MRELKPLKVTIGLNKQGQADYPNFNVLQAVLDSGMDWSQYVDVVGDGWHYDSVSGHKEDTSDSPYGQQFGVILAPEDFVTQATAMFPTVCVEINESQFETFYNEKAHVNEPDEKIDTDILTGIKLKQDLGQALTAEQLKALDPDDDTPGVVKNKSKTWVDYKDKKNITIKK